MTFEKPPFWWKPWKTPLRYIATSDNHTPSGHSQLPVDIGARSDGGGDGSADGDIETVDVDYTVTNSTMANTTVTSSTITDTVTNSTVANTVTNVTMMYTVTNSTVANSVTNATMTDTVTNPTNTNSRKKNSQKAPIQQQSNEKGIDEIGVKIEDQVAVGSMNKNVVIGVAIGIGLLIIIR